MMFSKEYTNCEPDRNFLTNRICASDLSAAFFWILKIKKYFLINQILAFLMVFKQTANIAQLTSINKGGSLEKGIYHAEMNEQNSGEYWSDGADGGGWSTTASRSS